MEEPPQPVPTPSSNHNHCRPLGAFPPPIIIPPLSPPHKHTIIFLHGRGSSAHKFHGPLLAAPAPSQPLAAALPHARFVFPTAPLMRARKYRRCAIHQWYEGTGDWEPESRGEMRPAAEHLRAVLRAEVACLEGDARRVVLAGISQGCAMALTSLLLWEGGTLGAVVGMCGYMPLASSLMAVFDGDSGGEDGGVVFGAEVGSGPDDDIFERDPVQDARTPLERAVDELREEVEMESLQTTRPFPFLSTPIFMGHGTADIKVEYQHGQHAAKLLDRMGMSVDFHTYPGLGHWYSPEMLGHIVEFLNRNLDTS
ncbi:hypothetical protein AK830_g11821 [Neonectria ditissima]|uniref:Phospholipase/carboxylesterase/thioesterase domain-containing protein n=1 Tax=Neonectria ditissima TaxID=78410 RepID=A0A0P7AC08_9HYPO|nr:hypothetical protein AK830_g11821 [Neonectria ditissima]